MAHCVNSLRASFEARKALYGIHFDAKPEQLLIALSVLKNEDVVGLLPTGFGKTLCMLIPAMVSDVKTITLIVSPLKALMGDQMSKISRLGFKVAQLGPLAEIDAETIAGIRQGNFDVVLTSPESALSPHWKTIFLSDTWQERIRLLAIDEAHCISDWGENFRPHYRMLHELRSIFLCPVMALTATTTKKVKADIIKFLQLDTASLNVVSIKPDRPNIFLDIQWRCENTAFLSIKWLITHIREKQCSAKKTIVYCRNLNTVAELFSQTKAYLGMEAYASGQRKAENLLVEMFHNATHDTSKKRIMDSFSQPNSTLRCVFATIALGMGIDIADVDLIVHVGSPKSILTYWQEVGRCARDGRRGYALSILDNFTLSLKNTDTELSNLMRQSQHACFRKLLMQQFEGEDVFSTGNVDQKCDGCGEKGPCDCKLCTCCTYCKGLCECQKRLQHNISEFLGS